MTPGVVVSADRSKSKAKAEYMMLSKHFLGRGCTAWGGFVSEPRSLAHLEKLTLVQHNLNSPYLTTGIWIFTDQTSPCRCFESHWRHNQKKWNLINDKRHRIPKYNFENNPPPKKAVNVQTLYVICTQYRNVSYEETWFMNVHCKRFGSLKHYCCI